MANYFLTSDENCKKTEEIFTLICNKCGDETGNNRKLCANCIHEMSTDTAPQKEPYRPIITDDD